MHNLSAILSPEYTQEVPAAIQKRLSVTETFLLPLISSQMMGVEEH